MFSLKLRTLHIKEFITFLNKATPTLGVPESKSTISWILPGNSFRGAYFSIFPYPVRIKGLWLAKQLAGKLQVMSHKLHPNTQLSCLKEGSVHSELVTALQPNPWLPSFQFIQTNIWPQQASTNKTGHTSESLHLRWQKYYRNNWHLYSQCV